MNRRQRLQTWLRALADECGGVVEQLRRDQLIYGIGVARVVDGKPERVDPTTLTWDDIHSSGPRWWQDES